MSACRRCLLLFTLVVIHFAQYTEAKTIERHLQNMGLNQVNNEFKKNILSTPAEDLQPDKAKRFCSDVDLNSKLPIDGKYYDVFRHEKLPIYYFHFRDSKNQDLMFDRMVTFSDGGGKKIDHKKILRPDYEGDDGMNIAAPEVVSFYNQMKESGFQLTSFEQRLLNNLIHNGEIKEENKKFVATKNFALISTSQQSHPATGAHEYRHAVYFTTSEYRQRVVDLYESLSVEDKKKVQQLLIKAGDHSLEKGKEIFYTEFGAYFRDPETLVDQLEHEVTFTKEDQSWLKDLAKKLNDLEKKDAAFLDCGGLAEGKNKITSPEKQAGQR